jgi:hypothetical protein
MKHAGLTRCDNCWTFEGPDKYSFLGWQSPQRLPRTLSGLDRGIAEGDLDAERRLDVWKLRSVQPKPGQVRPPQLRKLEP